jgi:hypothetical protein
MESSTTAVKLFKICTLAGKPFTFNFDVTGNVSSFRSNIPDQQWAYTLINQGMAVIYSNDNDEETIERIFEISGRSDELKLPEIKLHLTLNMGFPKIRCGNTLVTSQKIEKMEESNDGSEVICPITLQTVHYAVKLNGKFYDLHSISKYLASEIKHIPIDHIPKCPMRIELPYRLIRQIIKHHTIRGSYFNPSKTSMEMCLWNRPERLCDQKEYDELILGGLERL